MLQDLLERYKTEICSTCKAKCSKGICIIQSDVLSVRCLDYVEDERKIKEQGKVQSFVITAKREKPLMRGFI